MKKTKSFYVIIFIMLSLLLVSFIGYKNIDTPTINGMRSFEISKYDNGTFKGHANVILENKNFFKITCKKLQFNMQYKGHIVATGNLTESVVLKKKDTTLFPVDFIFHLDSLKEDLTEFLMKDSVMVTNNISGTFSVLNLSINDSKDMWLKPGEIISQLITDSSSGISPSVKSISVKNFSLQTTTLQLLINFPNNFPIDIKIDSINTSVYADRELSDKVADWVDGQKKEIPGKSNATIDGLVEINNMSSGMSGFSKLLKGELDYFVKGFSIIDIDGRKIQIPIYQHFAINPLNQKITIIND